MRIFTLIEHRSKTNLALQSDFASDGRSYVSPSAVSQSKAYDAFVNPIEYVPATRLNHIDSDAVFRSTKTGSVLT